MSARRILLVATCLCGMAIPAFAGSPPGIGYGAVGAPNGVAGLSAVSNLSVPGDTINLGTASVPQTGIQVNPLTSENNESINSIFVGANAGAAYPFGSSEGFGSVAVGAGAFQSMNVTGLEGVAVGDWACQNVTSANGPTCLGMHAGGAITTEGGDVLVGNDAMRDAISSQTNSNITASGHRAIAHGIPGASITAYGNDVMQGESGGLLITGTPMTGDVITATIATALTTPQKTALGLTGLPVSVTYTVLNTDTLSTIAVALAGLLNGTVNGNSYKLQMSANTTMAITTEVGITGGWPGGQSNGWQLTVAASDSDSALTFTTQTGSVETTTVGVGDHSFGSVNLGSVTNGTAVGAGTGNNYLSGSNDTLIGYNAGTDLMASGGNNTFVGSGSGGAALTSAGNTSVGAGSGSSVTSGINNTFIGLSAGNNVTTGGGNLMISTSSSGGGTAPSALVSDYMNIGGGVVGLLYNPSVVSGFGTSPTEVGGSSIAFEVTVGTGSPGSSGVINFGLNHFAAAHQMACHVDDLTAPQTYYDASVPTTGTLTTEVTVTNYSRSSNTATAWPTGEQLQFQCNGY